MPTKPRPEVIEAGKKSLNPVEVVNALVNSVPGMAEDMARWNDRRVASGRGKSMGERVK